MIESKQFRFVIEAAVIIAVAVGAGVAHLGRAAIALAIAAVWLAVGVVEYRVSRRYSERWYARNVQVAHADVTALSSNSSSR